MLKRGQGHIEFVLSLVLFIGAVAFAFFFLSPAAESEIVDSTLPFTFNQIKKNVSVQLDSYSVKLDPGFASIPISGLVGKNSRVENYDGSVVLPSRISEGNVNLRSPYDFVVIKVSEDFVQGTPPETDSQVTFTIASTRSEDIISEKRVKALEGRYINDYDSLKQEFDLPPIINFGFALVFSDSDFTNARRDIPAGLEVFSTIKRVEVLREDGSVTFADFSVTVW